MAVTLRQPATLGADVVARARVVSTAVLRGYSQIVFSRSPVVGLLLLGATAWSPRLLAAGLLAVGLASAVAALVRLSPELTGSGLFGYNALLVGLGGAALLGPAPTAIVLVAVAVAVSVLVTAAVHSALGAHFDLPALTIPFLLVFYATLAAAPALGIPLGAGVLAGSAGGAGLGLPEAVESYLSSLGAIFFLPDARAGLFVALGLVVFSRVGLLLSLVGYGVGALVGAHVVVGAAPSLRLLLELNGAFTAIALGGIWFVPSLSSFAFAAAGALASSLLTLALAPLFALVALPMLILPFNLTVILLLYAMRQRIRDGQPKAVDFLLGTPEQNLSYYRTRVARFGARYAARFRAPFLGRWVVTQGVDGPITHRGPWRYALDFEVRGSDGSLYKGGGGKVADYYCYRLPVLAVADGTVVKVVDGVPDNKVGETNLEQNWGNLVILYHGPWLYSMVCHLAPGSLKVREGQVVRAGDVLGSCGSSGRSPTPHLHFQLQATARVGAPTLPLELHDVVLESEDGPPRLCGTLVPAEGEVVRNLEPQPDLARLLELRVGERLALASEGHEGSGRTGRAEVLEPDIDLWGRLVLRSDQRGATLFYDHRSDLFTVYDAVGARRSHLGLLQLALGRVPFEVGDLVWRDVAALRHVWPHALGWALDLVAPFLPARGIEIAYQAERRGRELIVTGRSPRQDLDGTPWVATTAVLEDGVGLQRLEVTLRGRKRVAVRVAGSRAAGAGLSEER